MYKMALSDLCTPALIYAVISMISLFFAIVKNFQFTTIMVKILIIIAWTWFLNFLCSKGYKSVSWFLVLLPFIVMAGMFIMAMDTIAKTANARHM